MEKEKKGFWASLFSPKPKKCCCGDSFPLPENAVETKKQTAAPTSCNVQEIKVLGAGCAKCKSTYSVVEKVLQESGQNIRLTKVEDIEEIMRYNILSTPAIVVDDQVVIKGKVPTETEVKQVLGL